MSSMFPNLLLFTEPLANYTAQFPFIWNEIPILLTFESDWKRAKAIFQDILDERMGGRGEGGREGHEDGFQTVLHSLQEAHAQGVHVGGGLRGPPDSAVHLRRSREAGDHRRTLGGDPGRLSEWNPKLDFAYPTTRMYHNILEGKTEARAPFPPGLEGVLDQVGMGVGETPT